MLVLVRVFPLQFTLMDTGSKYKMCNCTYGYYTVRCSTTVLRDLVLNCTPQITCTGTTGTSTSSLAQHSGVLYSILVVPVQYSLILL